VWIEGYQCGLIINESKMIPHLHHAGAARKGGLRNPGSRCGDGIEWLRRQRHTAVSFVEKRCILSVDSHEVGFGNIQNPMASRQRESISSPCLVWHLRVPPQSCYRTTCSPRSFWNDGIRQQYPKLREPHRGLGMSRFSNTKLFAEQLSRDTTHVSRHPHIERRLGLGDNRIHHLCHLCHLDGNLPL
jgi:hypothetical protein